MCNEHSSKQVEYYAASVTAWYQTQLEHDKQIITLSAAGIGLLVTLMTAVGIRTIDGLLLYVFAFMFFVLAIFNTVMIFKQNATLIEEIISESQPVSEKKLNNLDFKSIYSFFLGVLFTIAIAFSTAIHSYNQKEDVYMSEKINETNVASKPVGNYIEESFKNAASLKPKPTDPQPTPQVEKPEKDKN